MGHNNHILGIRIVGGLILLAVIVVALIIAGRRFGRRGPGGLQHYPDYKTALVTGTGEGCLRVLIIILVIVVVCVIAMTFINPSRLFWFR